MDGEVEPGQGNWIENMKVVLQLGACRGKEIPAQHAASEVSKNIHFCANQITSLRLATEDVDPTVVARLESMRKSVGWQCAIKEGVRAAPGWELDALAGMQVGETCDADRVPRDRCPSPHSERRDLLYQPAVVLIQGLGTDLFLY